MFDQVFSMSTVVIVYFVILQELVGLLQIIVSGQKLELWPGYVTSIRQHETNILMCCEINHKVMRQETALELLTACIRGDGRMYKVSVTSLLLWAAVFVHLPNVHYLFVCNVQKHLNLQKCARSKFVFAVFSMVERMLASVILYLCIYISQMESKVARKVVRSGLILCDFFSRAFTLMQLENLHHCFNSCNHILLNAVFMYTICDHFLSDLAQTICGCNCRGLWPAGSNVTVMPSVTFMDLLCS